MNKILLFIPMYNCKNQIQRVLDQIDDEIMEYVNEIIVIDNGSNDGSRETVLEYIKDRSLKKNCYLIGKIIILEVLIKLLLIMLLKMNLIT